MTGMVLTRTDNLNERTIRRLYDTLASRQHVDDISSNINALVLSNIVVKPSCLKVLLRFFKEIGRAFPDYKLNIENLLVKGDKVMVRYTITGTHREEFMGAAPTNERTDISGIDAFHLREGKIIYHWNSTYQLNALPQMN